MTYTQWAVDIVSRSREAVGREWQRAAAIRRHNQRRVLAAFKRAQVSEYHLAGTTGYGYNDPARDALEQIYADVLPPRGLSTAPGIGTRHFRLLFGVLRPGDELMSATDPLMILYSAL